MESRNPGRIGVQTARMLEIYALLNQELEGDALASLPVEERQRLQEAIATIAGNMRQLQGHLVTPAEEENADALAPSSPQLDQILEAVLKWHQPNEEGE